MDENTKVFKIALTNNSLEMTKIDDGIINLSQGVVLKSTSASIPLYYSATGSATIYSDNSLLGTMTTIINPGNAFVLNKGSQGIGFYKLSASGTIGAHKAYLTYDGSSARAFFSFDEDSETTSISEIETMRNVGNETFYNLNGQKVQNPTKGLYIVNGKKVIIK